MYTNKKLEYYVDCKTNILKFMVNYESLCERVVLRTGSYLSGHSETEAQSVQRHDPVNKLVPTVLD